MKGLHVLAFFIAASAFRPSLGLENDKKAASKQEDPAKAQVSTGLDEELEFEADVQQMEESEKKLSCVDLDDVKCLKNISCTHNEFRKMCPRTCLVCCADKVESFCKIRKRYCHAKYAKERMRHYCPKTCGYCGRGSCVDLDDDKCLKNRKSCTLEEFRKMCPRTCLVCCADKDENFCKIRKRYCHAKDAKDRMRHYCPKTCGYCGRAPAPPPCLSTQFGCCWDKSTPASAPLGSGKENCPPCKDKQSQKFCKMFESYCTDNHPDRVRGRQIRAFCPKTCRICGENPQCLDHPTQQLVCPKFKADGLCKTNENSMRFYCPKTCGFCKPCYDNLADKCGDFKKIGACTASPERMRSLCRFTCKFCL